MGQPTPSPRPDAMPMRFTSAPRPLAEGVGRALRSAYEDDVCAPIPDDLLICLARLR